MLRILIDIRLGDSIFRFYWAFLYIKYKGEAVSDIHLVISCDLFSVKSFEIESLYKQ